MSNFNFLLSAPQFEAFASAAVSAEKIYAIDASACVLNCRRAMEFAVKWMYSVDSALEMPYQDTLVSLMGANEFRDLVGVDLYRRMEFIRKSGNNAAHSGNKIHKEQALLCLENLHIFMDFVAYCYTSDVKAPPFDPALVGAEVLAEKAAIEQKEVELKALIKQNEALKEELTARREAQKQTYVPKPLELSEYKTRKIYIDTMLQDAGWTEGQDWLNEVELEGMPNKSEVGFADYVLYDDMHKPLAVIEAKRTCVDVSKGRHQGDLYADLLEKKYHVRPVVFLTNGFETRIRDGQYPERRVSCMYSKRDLEKLFNLRRMKTPLENIQVNKEIAGRYYQEGAIKAVCGAFQKQRRKALLVMATGSGKTRTVIALCDVLLKKGWVKNILFLADRNSLVTQAKRAFVNLLPDLSVTNLCESKDYSAHCVFSTYQTMMNVIDAAKDEVGKIFTPGHFDLMIVDEAHRSIYNKYKDIFTYFDAPLVGLTATPKDEIDKNTYEVFELESGVPTYGYELSQAVKDGYLTDYLTAETKLKFLTQGIVYEELSPEEKEEYEKNFIDENGELPEAIDAGALNAWIFNEDTIREALSVLMAKGLYVNYGATLGKTIIFAKSHRHAEKILAVFNKEYPHLAGQAEVIDNKINYAQDLIDQFSEEKKLPRIAISVDMLDTGIDVPSCLNLVFFKKVMSKAKFWQMIGRGTRLCPGLMDGEDKNIFYIFDFCGNFEFFRMNPGKPVPNQVPIQGAIFNLKAQIAYKLQDMEYQTEELKAFRSELVSDMLSKVRELNRENFAVHQHLKLVDRFSAPESYITLTYEDTLQMAEEISPLLIADMDDAKAVRFDALMYGIELAYLIGKKYKRARKDLLNKVKALSKIGNSPEVEREQELISKILHTDYLDDAGVNEFECIREKLRDLMKLIVVGGKEFETHFDDELLSIDWNESELDNDDLENYKAKAEFYVRKHQDNIVIAKLKSNIPLTDVDVRSLETILWSEIGTREDYVAEYGEKPLGEFVREIVGLDMNAAKEAFSEYLNGANLDARQIYFVNQVIEYIVHNGLMKDLSVLQESPFTDKGSVSELFTDLNVWKGIRGVINSINKNALFAS